MIASNPTKLKDFLTGARLLAPLIGLDLVEPARLAERMRRTPALTEELFHPGELLYSNSQPQPEQSLAARLAAKEAVHKALGLEGFDPLDVEIVGGGPTLHVSLHGSAATRARSLGVRVTVSLTHLESMAGAAALATTDDRP